MIQITLNDVTYSINESSNGTNRTLIDILKNKMMRWGIVIVDYGTDAARIGERSLYYAMEKSLIIGYEFYEAMFFWGGFR